MSTPDAKAANKVLIEKGHSSSKTHESKKTKVDVIISDAPKNANGTNGDYSLHMTPLDGHSIPYYQGIDGDLFQMFIIYNKINNRWELQNDKGTEKEKKFGLIAYIKCSEDDANQTYLRSVSGKKEWYVPTTSGGSDGDPDPNMVATVIGEPAAAAEAPAELSSTAAAPVASASSSSISTPSVLAPAASPVVVTAPTVTEMKTIITNISTQYNNVYGEYIALTSKSPDTDWINFKTNNLDKANTELKKALAQLDAFKKAGSGSSTSTATADPATSGLLSTEMIHDRKEDSAFKVGGSSSSSKKNRKSHKSYHPGIGKTRKHHSHSEPKRISFVHQA
jgi:hypothetical protein